MTSKPGRNWRKSLYDLKPEDSFIIRNSTTGITLRDDVGEPVKPSEINELPFSQTESLALNEFARKHYGVGKFFWIPSRPVRSVAADQGYCRNGPDLVYIPFVWSNIDNHLYDNATPYEHLRLTNAWTCLSPGDIVISIFSSYSKPTAKHIFPIPFVHAGVKHFFEFGTVSVLLLWDDFPNMVYLEYVKGLNLSIDNPRIQPNTRRAHRVRKLEDVLKKANEAWWSKKSNGNPRVVSMEEVYADALIPGPRKNETLALITWKSKQAQPSRPSQPATLTSFASSSRARDDEDDEEL